MMKKTFFLLVFFMNLLISQTSSVIQFRRVAEPNEGAFTFLVPVGWQITGGIFRVNPTMQGGAAQSIAAKLDLSVKKDNIGTVMLRWLPDMLYFDMSRSPAGQMGLFPPGSNYNGMTVYPVMPAEEYIRQIVFPSVHPAARQVQVTTRTKLPGLARQYLKLARATQPMIDFSYDAAVVSFTYSENGKQFEERMLAVVENWGQAGAGMWGNKETFYVRAPKGRLKQWEPVLREIRLSVIINQRWLSEEIRGQLVRAGIMNRTLQEMQRIDREIIAHRQQVNAEINHDFFLTVTEQEDYINPFTKQVETGSNQWRFRWENNQGDVIYTNQEDYNPNTDIHLNLSGFKLSRIRKR